MSRTGSGGWYITDVDRAVEAQNLEGVKRVGIDETSSRRGHEYVSVFADLDERRGVFVVEGRDHETVQAFWLFLETHGGDPEQVQEVRQDMSEPFVKGTLKHLPKAEITFDRYHIKSHLSKAVDEVRRDESKHHRELLAELVNAPRAVIAAHREYLQDRHELTWLETQLRALREEIQALLEQGVRGRHLKTQRFCAGLLDEYDALWTFREVEGIDPTNNVAERGAAPWRAAPKDPARHPIGEREPLDRTDLQHPRNLPPPRPLRSPLPPGRRDRCASPPADPIPRAPCARVADLLPGVPASRRKPLALRLATLPLRTAFYQISD